MCQGDQSLQRAWDLPALSTDTPQSQAKWGRWSPCLYRGPGMWFGAHPRAAPPCCRTLSQFLPSPTL